MEIKFEIIQGKSENALSIPNTEIIFLKLDQYTVIKKNIC